MSYVFLMASQMTMSKSGEALSASTPSAAFWTSLLHSHPETWVLLNNYEVMEEPPGSAQLTKLPHWYKDCNADSSYHFNYMVLLPWEWELEKAAAARHVG